MADTGLFLGKWQIGKTIPGAKLLHLKAMVSTPEKRISGQVTVTQATQEPLNVVIDVYGDYVDYVIGGTTVHIARIDNVDTGRFGAPSLRMLVVFDQNWQNGTAWFSLAIGSSFTEEADAPVVVEN